MLYWQRWKFCWNWTAGSWVASLFNVWKCSQLSYHIPCSTQRAIKKSFHKWVVLKLESFLNRHNCDCSPLLSFSLVYCSNVGLGRSSGDWSDQLGGVQYWFGFLLVSHGWSVWPSIFCRFLYKAEYFMALSSALSSWCHFWDNSLIFLSTFYYTHIFYADILSFSIIATKKTSIVYSVFRSGSFLCSTTSSCHVIPLWC